MLYSPRINLNNTGVLMKHFILFGIILLLLIALFFLPHTIEKRSQSKTKFSTAEIQENQDKQTPVPPSTFKNTDIQKKLDSIIVKHLDLKNKPLSDTISELRKVAQEADPEGKGINIVLIQGKSNKKKATSGAEEEADSITFSMEVSDLPLGELIRHICFAFNLKFHIDKNAVVITDKNTPLDKLETEFFPVSDGIEVLINRGKQEKNGLVLLNDFFKNRGVKVSKHTKIVYDKNTDHIIATATSAQMRQIERIIEEENSLGPEVIITARFANIPESEYSKINTAAQENNQSLEEQIIRSPKIKIIASETVITQNGEEAYIYTGNTLYYPDEWEDGILKIEEKTAEAVNNNKPANKEEETIIERKKAEDAYSPYMRPLNGITIHSSSTPIFLNPDRTGASIVVTPTVNPKRDRVTLNIIPRIRYFAGWTFYGKTIKIPKFLKWETTSQYKINDGNTIIAGGFIEDIINKKTGKHTKNRFLLLLTATLISPDGVPLHRQAIQLNPEEREHTSNTLSKEESELDNIIIGRVNYKNANIEMVVKELSQKVSQQNKNINFTLYLSDEDSCDQIPPVNLLLNNISLRDLLKYISIQTKLTYRYEDNNIIIGDDQPPQMSVASFKIYGDLIKRIPVKLLNASGKVTKDNQLLNTKATFHNNFQDAPRFKDFFSERGVKFPQGSTIEYNPSAKKIRIKNTRENIQKLRDLLFGMPPYRPQITVEGTMIEIDNDDLVKLIGRNAALSDNLTESQIDKIINSPQSRILASHIISTRNEEEGSIKIGSESLLPESWSSGAVIAQKGLLNIQSPSPEFGEKTLLGSLLSVTPSVADDHKTINISVRLLYNSLKGWSEYPTYIDITADKTHKRAATKLKMPELRKVELKANLKISAGSTIMLTKSQLMDLSSENNKLNASFTEKIEQAEKQHRKSKTIFYFVNAKIARRYK